MQKNLTRIRNCDCGREEIYPSLWVLIGECDKCRRQRETQMQLDDEGMKEESGILDERLVKIGIQEKRKSKF